MVQVHVFRITKNDATAAASSSTFEVRGGSAITAAAVVVVLPNYLPVLVCTWHTIRSSRISRPPYRSIVAPFNIY